MARSIIIIVLIFVLNAPQFILLAQQNEYEGLAVKEITELRFDSTYQSEIYERYTVLKTNPKILHGSYEAYNRDEVLFIQGFFSNGKENGAWIFRYINYPNNTYAEGNYKDGELEGEWNYYFENTDKQLKNKVFYLKGESIYKRHNFYSNGQIEASELYELHNDQYFITGFCEYWYDNGQKKAEGYRIFDELSEKSFKVETWKYWHDNGNLQLVELYDYTGQYDSLRTFYSKTGELEKQEEYKNGTLVKTQDRYDFQVSGIEPLISIAQQYQKDQSVIFKNEIADITRRFNNFVNMQKDDRRFGIGTELIVELNFVNKNHDLINENDAKISELIAIVDSLYIDIHPLIYKNEVKVYKTEVANYFELGFVKARIEKGSYLLLVLENLSNRYGQFTELERQMDILTPMIRSKYELSFPIIFNDQIAGLQPKIFEYRNINKVDEKYEAGKAILMQMEAIDNSFSDIDTVNKEINFRRAGIESSYKNNYSAIYKMEIAEYLPVIEAYKKIGNIEDKLAEGINIKSKFDMLDQNFTLLNEQMANINAKYAEFESNFEEDKNNKQLYKKGKKLYNDELDLYEAEGYSEKRLARGDDIIIILMKLNSFYNQDNAYLNGQLKNTKTTDDIKSVLGL